MRFNKLQSGSSDTNSKELHEALSDEKFPSTVFLPRVQSRTQTSRNLPKWSSALMFEINFLHDHMVCVKREQS
jgi:hypothetical protein